MRDPKIQFYQSLSTLLEAGVPIFRALPTAARGLRGSWRRLAQSLETDIRQGTSLAESMAQKKRFFETLEVELVRTGEQTGQLAEILGQLSRWREFLLRMKRMFWSGMALPIFILHAAAVILPLPILGRALLMGEGRMEDYFSSAGRILLIFYVPAVLTWVLLKLKPSRGIFRKVFDSLLCALPLVGRVVKNLSLSRYAWSFSMLYGAGVPIVQAAEQATRNCGNWLMEQRLQGAYRNAKKGQMMSEGFPASVDAQFREVWLVGEETGDLDRCSERLGQMYAERAQVQMQFFARGFPVAVYLIITAALSIAVVRGFLAIYGTILSQ